MDIYLKRAIMHIVDRQTGDPVILASGIGSDHGNTSEII